MMRWIAVSFPILVAGVCLAVEPASGLPALSSTTAVSTYTVHVDSAVGDRQARERSWDAAGLRIVPYKPNYILPFSYVPRPNDVANNFLGSTQQQDIEAKFQFSVRLPAARGLFWNHGDLSFAYTQVSYWQVYNQKGSAPFRETNYEPEVMIAFQTLYEILGLNARETSLGFVHQSNGRTEPLSRGWNRVYVQNVLERGNLALMIRPWIKLPEFPTDDNADISRYMGNFDLRLAYKWKDSVWTALMRNNLRAKNKGAMELGSNFPFFGLMRSYIQFFHGYGESLIDYNHSTTRIGVGVIFTDWL